MRCGTPHSASAIVIAVPRNDKPASEAPVATYRVVMRPVRIFATAVAGVMTLALSACDSSSGDSDGATEGPTSGQSAESSGPPEATVLGSGYTISMPERWQDVRATVTKTKPVDVAVAEPKQGETFRMNFNVLVPRPVPDDLSDQDLVTQGASLLTSVTHHPVKSAVGPDFDGSASLEQRSNVSASGLPLTLLQYVVVNHGHVYATTMTYERQRADEAKDILDGIVDSWHWTSPDSSD